MTTLDLILSRVALTTEAIRDRVTGGAEQVLGKRKPIQAKTVWAVGDFPYPWPSEAAEAEAIRDGEWFPSEVDFAAAMKNSGFSGSSWLTVGSTAAFIALVVRQPKGSIRRLNFVTHGASDEIGLSGTVEPGAVFFTDGLDEAELDGFRVNGILNDDGTVTPWSDVRARFAPDAEIVIYACKAALDAGFLQVLADTFGVTVKAFSTELHYSYPMADLELGIVPRSKLTVDGGSNLTVLKPDVTVKARATAPEE
ncbi:hypothetical protein ABZ477_10725 [Microbacterium sp. NPDC019599]|uniref:hypothetical protein n=1 Tax=Microbacterium sp. NPDC019599 TaxID=3154690 RepID=UPI0034063E10